MIKIQIIADRNGKILDRMDDRDCTFQEVSCALLRLKQIEQKLIDKEFEEIFSAEEN